MDKGQKVIKKAVIRMLLYFLLAVSCTLFSIWCAAESNDLKVVIAGYSGIILCGGVSLLFIWMLFRNTGLTLNNEGLMDNSNLVGGGFIPWTEVIGLKIIEEHNQKFIIVQIKDPEQYIANQSNTFKRKLMRLNYRQYGSPVTISVNFLNMGVAELLPLMREYRKAAVK